MTVNKYYFEADGAESWYEQSSNLRGTIATQIFTQTPRSRIRLEKLTVPRPVEKLPTYLCYPEVHHRADKSHQLTLILGQINPFHPPPQPTYVRYPFNIILPSTHSSSKQSLSLRYPPPPPKTLYASLFLIRATWSAYLILIDLITHVN